MVFQLRQVDGKDLGIAFFGRDLECAGDFLDQHAFKRIFGGGDQRRADFAKQLRRRHVHVAVLHVHGSAVGELDVQVVIQSVILRQIAIAGDRCHDGHADGRSGQSRVPHRAELVKQILRTISVLNAQLDRHQGR